MRLGMFIDLLLPGNTDNIAGTVESYPWGARSRDWGCFGDLVRHEAVHGGQSRQVRTDITVEADRTHSIIIIGGGKSFLG